MRAFFGMFVATLSAQAAPTLPNINTNFIVVITNAPYNAVGDGATDNTLAISNAIVAASAGGNVGGLFGGTVRIPPGTFLSGPLTLKNNVDIHIDAGATLKMLPVNAFIGYPPQSGNGLTYGDLIYASGVTNLEISGSGTIDGQGLLWWTNSVVSGSRPYMIYFNGNCRRVLVQDVTVQNPPKMHFVFKGGSDGNITFQNMNINTTDSRANQCDGIDLVGTNILVQNCTINAGDDNIALGSSSASAFSANVLVTNCAFGTGHGVSIGSNTAGSVSNLTVIYCTFNGTDYGIRMKSNDNTSGGAGQGGIAQNLNYLNIGMTNINDGAVVIYSYYDSNAGGQFGTPTSVSPYFASTQAVDVTTVPVWRNITISNLTATVASGGVAGIIWARMEAPATNIVFNHVNITAPKPFDIYNAFGVQFIDSQITPPAGSNTFLIYHAQVTISNSAPSASLVTFDGLTTNGFGNILAFYNTQASLKNTNAFDDGPLMLAAGIFTISNNLALFPSTVLNFTLGSNAATIAIVGNLTLGGTINLTNGPGFAADNYTLLTYSGTLNGNLPTLGSTPMSSHALLYGFNTNTPGQVNFIAATPPPPRFTSAATLNGTNVIIGGTGGTTNFPYVVVTSTNLALPLSQWMPVMTNSFSPGGNFFFTNPLAGGQKFFMLQYP